MRVLVGADASGVIMAHIHSGAANASGPVVVGLVPVNASVSGSTLPMLSPPADGDLKYK